MERCAVWSPTSAILMLGVFFLSFGLLAPRAWASPNENNLKVQRLLSQARYQAGRLNRDANRMAELVNSNVGWQAREHELARVKAHVNDLGKVIYKLESSRVDASPWQKQSIDHLVPVLREVAVNTTDEIDYLNSDQAFADSPQYNNLAYQSASMSQELSSQISNIIRYGKDRSQLARLSDNLDLQAHPANG